MNKESKDFYKKLYLYCGNSFPLIPDELLDEYNKEQEILSVWEMIIAGYIKRTYDGFLLTDKFLDEIKMTPFEYYKKLYLLYGDNFEYDILRDYDDSYRDDIFFTWGFNVSKNKGYYLSINGNGCKFIDKFWKELNEIR